MAASRFSRILRRFRFSTMDAAPISPLVRAAMKRVPREAFVPPELAAQAQADAPLPIGFGQTISQPYVVAWMSDALQVQPGMRVLEVGTGSGYQTAILAELGAEVFSLEIVPELHARARDVLTKLGYADRVHLRLASGYDGWPDAAPFAGILLTAAPPEIPQTLIDQLADGGRLVAPVGTDWQIMVILTRHGDQITRRESLPVRFVPMK